MSNENLIVDVEVSGLTASETDRTTSGLLLPFGEQGATSQGRITVARGAVKLPRDPEAVYANLEHERFDPVGHATSVEETDQGILATFRIANTDEGDQLLADIKSGARKSLSVELGRPVIRDGSLVSAKLAGAAFVAKPAFPSAMLFASDFGDLIEEIKADVQTVLETTAAATADAVTETPTAITEPLLAAETEVKENPMPEAVNPGDGLTASAHNRPQNSQTKRQAAHALCEYLKGTLPEEQRGLVAREFANSQNLFDKNASHNGLFASLTNVPFTWDGSTGPSPFDISPSYVGAIFQGTLTQPVVRDLVQHADLNSPQVRGFKIGTKPSGAAWAGSGAAIHSGTALTTSQIVTDAEYWASGNNVSIEYSLFGLEDELLEQYLEYLINSYQLFTDAAILTAITPAGTDSTTAPTGVNQGWHQIVEGATQILSAHGGAPTFAVVEPLLFASMMETQRVNGFEYLNAELGFTGGAINGITIRPDLTGTLATGNILVGVGQAATFYELPGSPVRLSAVQVATGSTDLGLIAAYAVRQNNAASFALMQPHT